MKIFFTVANNHGIAYVFKEFKKSGYEVICGDMNKDAIGKHFADKFFILPPQKSDSYISRLLSIVEEQKIDILVPAGEYECLQIARNKTKFLELNCVPIVTNIKTLEICLDKAVSYDFLKENTDIPMMEYFIVKNLEDFNTGLLTLKNKNIKKLCIKPSEGSGTRGFALISDKVLNAEEFFMNKNSFPILNITQIENMLTISENIPKLILMEYVDDMHYDSNMICKNGNVLFQSVRTREEAKIGTITKATIVKNERIYEINKKIAKAFDVDGYICTQYIGDKLIEINPRWSTSLIYGGINEYQMSIDIALGKSLEINADIMEHYINVKFLRYFDVLVFKNDR